MLLTELKANEERQRYAAKAVEHGRSRNVMWHHMSAPLQQRIRKAVINFGLCLPAPESELAQQTLKDLYLLDFLGLSHEEQERDIETKLQGNATYPDNSDL